MEKYQARHSLSSNVRCYIHILHYFSRTTYEIVQEIFGPTNPTKQFTSDWEYILAPLNSNYLVTRGANQGEYGILVIYDYLLTVDRVLLYLLLILFILVIVLAILALWFLHRQIKTVCDVLNISINVSIRNFIGIDPITIQKRSGQMANNPQQSPDAEPNTLPESEYEVMAVNIEDADGPVYLTITE